MAMKLNSLVRRASSSIIPLLSIQSKHGAAIFPLNAQFRPFLPLSTVVDNNNISSLLEPADHGSGSQHNSTSVPDITSFKVQDTCFPDFDLALMSESHNQEVLVHVAHPYTYEDKKPVSEVEVSISNVKHRIHFDLLAKGDEIKVEKARVRTRSHHLENFEGYLRSKGITVDMINMMFHLTGINTKNNTEANPK